MNTAGVIATDMGILPGDVIGGRYRVVRVIGHGGMGVVVEAVHESLEQRVAIKFLRPTPGSIYGEAATRFLQEAKALARFRSAHFARVTDVSDEGDEVSFFVMEYLDGHDLAARLAVDGPLSVEKAVDYALQVCEALAEAYTAGIVHRDIKPANLFLTTAPDGSTLVKLLDFGISKLLPAEMSADVQMTGTHALLGSPRYMAPEQMRKARKVDHRADIWSLGVVMHESLTGAPPFVGETLPEVCAAIAADDPVRVRQLRRDVPIELQDIILRCLSKDPEKRYATVSELATELGPFAPPEGAAIARRVARIVRGGASSAPPPLLSLPASSSPTLRREAGLRTTGASRTNGSSSDAPPARVSLAPLPSEMSHGKRDLRGWAVLLVGIGVAIPAFVVGAIVSSPSPPADPRATATVEPSHAAPSNPAPSAISPAADAGKPLR